MSRNETYERLYAKVRELQGQGKLPTRVTRDQAIDWAYGNTKIENPNITREMVAEAYDTKATRTDG